MYTSEKSMLTEQRNRAILKGWFAANPGIPSNFHSLIGEEIKRKNLSNFDQEK